MLPARNQPHWYFPIPDAEKSEELEKETSRFVGGENLADFRNQDSPGNAAQVPHAIRTDPSVLSPHFHQPKRLPEILSLVSRQLEHHQIVLPPNQRNPALFILDAIQQTKVDDLLNVSGDGFSLQLAEADVNVDALVLEGDDRHARVCSGG